MIGTAKGVRVGESIEICLLLLKEHDIFLVQTVHAQ